MRTVTEAPVLAAGPAGAQDPSLLSLCHCSRHREPEVSEGPACFFFFLSSVLDRSTSLAILNMKRRWFKKGSPLFGDVGIKSAEKPGVGIGQDLSVAGAPGWVGSGGRLPSDQRLAALTGFMGSVLAVCDILIL